MKDNLVIIKIKSSVFKTKKGFAYKKDFYFLKRKCKGYNFLEEDILMIGINNIIEHITNFINIEDGIYEVIIHNEKKDWESGNVEEYDYKLISYNEQSLHKM